MMHSDKITDAIESNRSRTPVGRNGWVDIDADGTITVRLYDTAIARRLPCGDIKAAHGGFVTGTTQRWISSALWAFGAQGVSVTRKIASECMTVDGVAIGEGFGPTVARGRVSPVFIADMAR